MQTSEPKVCKHAILEMVAHCNISCDQLSNAELRAILEAREVVNWEPTLA